MDTESIASLCLKILNATDSVEAYSVQEPLDDMGYNEYKQVFIQCFADVLSSILLTSLSDQYVKDDIMATLIWVLNGYGEQNVTALTRHVGCICTQLYSFESSIVPNGSGYVYVDGENLMFPEEDKPWNADTLMQLVGNVRGLYAKKKMTGFKAEPTVIVYHKTGKTSERLIDNKYPYHINVCGLRCGLECREAGKEIDDILLVTVAATRARMTNLPVVVYSHDRYRWLDDKPSIPVRFVRPKLTDKGYDLEFEYPMSPTFNLGAPMTNTVYGNAWEDSSGLGRQYVQHEQGWENVAGGITSVDWFRYLHYAPLITVTFIVTMLGTS